MPFDRRTFVLSGVAAALAGGLSPLDAVAQGSPDARLNALFQRIFDDSIDSSPEFATGLGLDKGARAKLKYKLDEDGLAARQEDLGRTKRWLGELERFPTAGLTPAAALNREIVLYSLRNGTVATERFGLDSVNRPYRIFQQGGAYFSTPDFLNDTHTIETAADAEAYLSRLDRFARVLDQDVEVQRHDAARGYAAPAWSLDLTLGQMEKLRGQPAASSAMVNSLVTRARAKNVAGDWGPRAARIVETRVYPALDRQIAFVRDLRDRVPAGDGVWRVPQSDAIYAAALRQSTTTDFTPDEVHRMGLEQVAQISGELDGILRGAGLTQGSVGARLAQLNKRPDQLYPDTPEGRAQLIASLNRDVEDMRTRLPRAFVDYPQAPLEVRAVPVEIQDGASNGYYRRAALDGSRPAIYYINLKDVGDWPKYGLPALTYHEGDPGHHLQISTQQLSTDIPMLRKIGFFGAYSEGWALYAEQLADELGAYKTPLDRAGYLQSFLFRAARLVVDTGIHTKRWSREKATRYMVDTTGFAEPRSQREVERYCTQPGQACSYKVGHMAWVRARQAAEKRLGDRFDLKRFHAILKDGAMPLSIMERLSAERMA
jgi:uncharacterized protein (DUF885 family)